MVDNFSYKFSDNHYFHVFSDGTKLKWLFKDDEDFISGINRIGICSFVSKVQIYSYVLMDNHLHILIYGSDSKCEEFINKYKLLTGKWIRNKYGKSDYPGPFYISAIKLETADHVYNVLAYIDRNVINTNYPYLISEYPWGSAKYLFKERVISEGIALGTIGKKQKRLMLKTHIGLPDSWHILPDGMLNPISFVSFEKTEALFQTPRKYIFYLSKKVEGDIDNQVNSTTKAYVSDKELRIILKGLTKKMFGEESHLLLDINSKIKLAKKLRYEYYSTPKQISRMLGISIDILKGYI